MKTLTNHRLFGCLASYTRQDPSAATEELSSIYDEYAASVTGLSGQDIPVTEKLRQLYQDQIELKSLQQSLQGHPDTEVGICLQKAASLVEAEIKLTYFTIRHPECKVTGQSVALPSLRWKGSLVNLMELISSLDYSGIIADESGGHLSFAGLVSAFEKLFNISIPKPYDLRADLSRRKKSLSILLPRLKEAYEKNIIQCGIDKK